ncbi:MAG: secondary thiamine-phosphate synthase enzyme YjbQ [Planctomycetaceae bacterium]
MKQHQERVEIATRGRGLQEITDRLRAAVRASGVRTGLAVVYCTHTSCSLLVQENADPSARHDMERWLERLAPAGDPAYTHTAEGPDDMPSHLRALVTRTSETFPVVAGEPALGRWQGLYLAEHRARPHTRRLVIHVTGL